MIETIKVGRYGVYPLSVSLLTPTELDYLKNLTYVMTMTNNIIGERKRDTLTGRN